MSETQAAPEILEHSKISELLRQLSVRLGELRRHL